MSQTPVSGYAHKMGKRALSQGGRGRGITIWTKSINRSSCSKTSLLFDGFSKLCNGAWWQYQTQGINIECSSWTWQWLEQQPPVLGRHLWRDNIWRGEDRWTPSRPTPHTHSPPPPLMLWASINYHTSSKGISKEGTFSGSRQETMLGV